MSEYIEREALLRALSKEVEYGDDGEQEINSDTVFITIEGFPAADVAQVVKCKDCGSYRMLEGANNKKAHICALGFGLKGLIAANDFCSYGERNGGAE